MKHEIGIGEVIGFFVLAMFALGLLIYTGVANLALLTHIYPDPAFVGFGLLALHGGTVVWTAMSFLSRRYPVHFGLCLIGLGVDTLLSFVGFMYELLDRTGTHFPINLPVIYVIGFSVIFNVGASLVYKLIPTTGN